MIQKVPREGLADLLLKLSEHARTYVLTGLSVHFDGSMYRVVAEGEGELVLASTVGNSQKNADEDADTEPKG